MTLPQVIHGFGQLNALTHNLPHLGTCLLHNLDARARDERMQRLVLARQRLSVLATNLALFDRSLTTDDDLGACLRAFNKH